MFSIKTPSSLANLACCALAALAAQSAFPATQLPVNLRSAGNYTILAKSGISTVPTSAIAGNIAVSPIDSTAITGFSLILDGTSEFATSTQVSGKIYAPNYASPTPVSLTAAVGDMETAFTDAAGRSNPDFTEHGAGNIGGLTLAPGLYKWGTGVEIQTDVTIAGAANDVWIFQVAGNVTMASAKSVILSGGAQAKNIFWQVAGGVGVNIGSDAHFEGTILAQAGINLNTGASLNGRLLSQTAVTLKSNSVTPPAVAIVPGELRFGPVTRSADGTVTLVLTNTPSLPVTVQHSVNLTNWNPHSTTTPLVTPYRLTDATSGTEVRFYRAFYP